MDESPSRRKSFTGAILNQSELMEEEIVNTVKSEPLQLQPAKRHRRREVRRRTINATVPAPILHENVESLNSSDSASPQHGVYKTFHTSSPCRHGHEDEDWKRVVRSGSVDRLPIYAEPSPSRFVVQPVVNVFFNNDPVMTSNKYGLLNNSVHDDCYTPTKERVTSGNGVGSLKPKKLFDDRKGQRQKHLKPKRSKSTSPTRGVATHKDRYKNINPDMNNWK